MKPVYKIMAVSALALTVSLPAMAQNVVDTQANAQMYNRTQAAVAAPAQPTNVQTRPAEARAESVQGSTGTYVSQQAGTSQETSGNNQQTAPVFRDPQMAVMMQPEQRSADPMDYKNTENLRKQTGFVALNTDEQIETDNRARGQAHFNANTPPEIHSRAGVSATTQIQQAQPSYQPQPQQVMAQPQPAPAPQQQVMMQQPQPTARVVTTAPSIDTGANIMVRSTDPKTQETHTAVTSPQALGNSYSGSYNAQPNVASSIPVNSAHTDTVTLQMPATGQYDQAGNVQGVNKSMIVVGNSDTGVDLNALAR